MNYLRHSAAAIAIVASSQAYAGEEVLYHDAPEWVVNSEMPDLEDESLPAQLIWDWQYRLEDGVVHAYVDSVFRIDNPQAQMEQNQQSLSWLPDKGDLTVHRVEIYRDGEVLDLVADGVRFEVIRRELGLERRLLDGELTATLSVPGLRVGDILRISHSISTDDQALGEEVQALQYLYSDPWQVGQSRVTISWPEDEEMFWDVEDPVDIGELEQRGGFNFISVDMPLAKVKPIPHDAPYRYRRPSVLRVGSFEDWNEVSAVMAPHYVEAIELTENSEVLAKSRSIMSQTDDPLERAALALRFVQEEVSYLLDGLDGGNYLPQHADMTWDVRYGDCKAKTVLLLAMLQTMGIESEPLLVHSRQGDAVPELLPLPAAFDHVIVRAVIDGKEYWLDGTMTGSRLSTIADVPAFHYGLPIRDGGADLIPLISRIPEEPQFSIKASVDQSAGVDFPGLFEIDISVAGPAGAVMRSLADENNPATLRGIAKGFNNVEGMLVSSFSVDYDEELALAKLSLQGIAPTSFTWEDGRLTVETETFSQDGQFNPDRARPQWQDIPVVTPGPMRQRIEIELKLPENGEGFGLAGNPVLEGGYGNLWQKREVEIVGDAVREKHEIVSHLGEISAADLPEAKRAAKRLLSDEIELVPPEEFSWRWELNREEVERKARPIIAAYGRAIEFAEEDDYRPLQERAYFLTSIYDFKAALADYDLLIEESPSAWTFYQRALVHRALGNEDSSIADLRAAYDLDPDNAYAHELARRMAYGGNNQEAEDLVVDLPVSEDGRVDQVDTLATLLGLRGEAAAGHAMIAELVAEQPQNSDLLNGDCWFRGTFNYALDTALARCTEAVETSGNPYNALDSRALIHFRQGNFDAAIEDLNAVLEIAPGVAASLYLRGVTRLHAGDRSGQRDIDQAEFMLPYIADFYDHHGIEPPR